jgi:hypothetical protein
MIQQQRDPTKSRQARIQASSLAAQRLLRGSPNDNAGHIHAALRASSVAGKRHNVSRSFHVAMLHHACNESFCGSADQDLWLVDVLSLLYMWGVGGICAMDALAYQVCEWRIGTGLERANEILWTVTNSTASRSLFSFERETQANAPITSLMNRFQ